VHHVVMGKFGLEAVTRVAPVAAAGEAGGEHHAVVGQHAGRPAVAGDRVAEGGDHRGAGQAGEGDAGQQQPGVVVEEVEDPRLGRWPAGNA
jgi:hypothetical protein